MTPKWLILLFVSLQIISLGSCRPQEEAAYEDINAVVNVLEALINKLAPLFDLFQEITSDQDTPTETYNNETSILQVAPDAESANESFDVDLSLDKAPFESHLEQQNLDTPTASEPDDVNDNEAGAGSAFHDPAGPPLDDFQSTNSNRIVKREANVTDVTENTPDKDEIGGVTPDESETAKKAQYQFATRTDNNVQGSFQEREETREGDKVTGSYSYDDGNMLRTVVYEADKHGFRIIKDERTPSIKAMQELDNHVDVMTYMNGDTLKYEITGGPY